ncbi:TIM44-like domain-containing protein [Roseomonas soli]|uniref:TIM44-like domain-containing protein n=2 Tax=Neoroseomonas soli TaxID=1081025 RepID=A0A9X9X2K7_9PROT|nr:TIM44-like domain-containing protein [Neoroseomonas soli]
MRRPALFLTAMAAIAFALAPMLAEARPGGGGSSGSRGSRTYSVPAPTQTAPSGAQRFDRTGTQPATTASRPGMAPGATPQRGFFGSFGGALLAGGLIGALLGYGLFGGGAGFGAILGMLLQIALIGVVVMLVMRLIRRRQQPAAASGPQPYAFQAQPEAKQFGGVGGMKAAAPADAPVAVTPADYKAFEQTLVEMNAAWSRRDLQGLRAVATPEMVSYFAQDMRDLEARNWRNETRDVRLEQGDLSEAWHEDGEDFATVAMRFSLLDATFDNATNKVVEGSTTQRTEATELWTFVRKGPGGKWMLSAIQQTQPA